MVTTEHENDSHDPALSIKTDAYEGPLEVLLELIRKRKMFINDLSLADVSDDFLEFIRSKEVFPVETSTQFLEIASTLMLLKSRSLLPQLDITDEDEADIHDLEERLAAHKRIQDLSGYIRERWGSQRMYRRRRSGARAIVFAPTDEIRGDTLARIMNDAMNRVPTEKDIPQTEVRERVSLKETIENLQSRLQKAVGATFSQVSGHRRTGSAHSKEERITVVMHFLAVLELVKTGLLDAQQHTQYDDIHLEHQGVDVPNYDTLA